MAAVRSTDTGPEMAVRRLLHRLGYRYRLHVRKLPGCPDIVFPSRRKVIFVHGCFWHRHKDCRYATDPKTRTEFWQDKFRSNVARDRSTKYSLRRDGWQVLTIWQCQLKRPQTLVKRLYAFLSKK